MKNKIRIKKDIAVTLHITTNGEAQNLEGRDLRVEVNYNGQSNTPPVVISDYETDGNKLMFVFHGIHHRFLGNYTISVWENYGLTGQTVVDKSKAFELVATSEEEERGNEGNIEIASVDLGAADLALGIAGKDGEPFKFEDFTEEQILLLQKPARDKAEELQEMIDKTHDILDQASFVNEALEAVYGDAGIAVSDRIANVSGNRYYYDSQHPIQLHPGDVLKVTCTRNNGTALLNTSLLLVTYASAGEMLEYTSNNEQTVYISTYGSEDPQGCAYVIKRTDNLIDVCKKTISLVAELTKRIEALEKKV